MAIETTVAAVTVKVSFPVTPLNVAVIADVPTATEVASPVVVPMVATVAVAEAQVTCDERSFLVPSLYVPVAANWVVVPSAMLGLAGVMAIDVSVTIGAAPPPPPPPPHAATNPVRISRKAPAGPRRP